MVLGPDLHLPATEEDEVELFFRFEIDGRPLPPYAYIHVFREDGSLRAHGTRVGPFPLRTRRRIRFEACLPLEPPGDEPALHGVILIRPSAAPVPADVRFEDFVPELRRRIADPDTGEIPIVLDDPDADRGSLTSGRGWTWGDAALAKSRSSLATRFAAKVLESVDPRNEIKVETDALDTKSPEPHAIAIAALTRGLEEAGPGSDSATMRRALEAQREHLASRHFPELESWPMWELLTVAAHEQDEPIRREMFRRFKTGQVSTEHMARMASILAPAARRRPEQRGPGVEEDRLRYESALCRAIEEARTMPDRRAWMEGLLDRWKDYLFQSHKGGALQSYLPRLEADRARALEAIQ